MPLFHRKKRKLWPYWLLAIGLLWLGVGLYLYQWWQRNGVIGLLQNAEEEIEEELGVETDMFLQLAPHILGFRQPQTILLLFQNNTELRPGGGFIGAYAVVRMNRGKSEVLVVEGSENLDWRAPDEWQVDPPAPIKKYLGLERWYFRDSNWSPDFAVSAARALEFYQAEGGVAGDELTMVIGLTPTVLEELLRLTGPVTVDGRSFAADTVTEKLEYEVEIGYKERNIPREERKAIIEQLMQAVFARASASAFSNLTKHIETANRLVAEKQILAYSPDTEVQSLFDQHGLTGRVKVTEGDYLIWVDANLGALKTDQAIERNIRYEIRKWGNKEMRAMVTMTYQHNGKFDWRTTRYRTYARLYVPIGSISLEPEVDQGMELGKQWFGKFIKVEPGETVAARFIYRLPSTISDQINKGLYTLFVQKQLGSIGHGLTLDLDFGTAIKAATPAEAEAEWGDTVYSLESDLREGREFEVLLKH